MQKLKHSKEKKEADEEKKRQKEEHAQEIEMLNTKAQAQWQFQVATIEAQNASAQSEVALARQAAYGMAYHKSLQDNDDLFTDLASGKRCINS